MDLYLNEAIEDGEDWLDVVEMVLSEDDRFVHQRADDGDVEFGFRGPWCDAVGHFSWRDELPALLFTVSFSLVAPPERRRDAADLIARINENLWLGHFDLWSEDGSIMFRHALPMIGRSELATGEVHGLLIAALDAAERYYPAFDLLLTAGRTPQEAVAGAMFEIVGEA